jgi:hypothetical protein
MNRVSIPKNDKNKKQTVTNVNVFWTMPKDILLKYFCNFVSTLKQSLKYSYGFFMRIERQLQGTLNTIFTELIKEKGLEKRLHPYTSQEEFRADITLKNSNGKPIFFIELKDPNANDGKSVFDGNVMMREMERAQKNSIKYFGICNFLACAFFETEKIYDKVSVNEGFFTLYDITRLSLNYIPSAEIQSKLRIIAEFYLARAIEIINRKPVTFSQLDELFIFRIRKLIEMYALPISEAVWTKYKSDKAFEKSIDKYFQTQLWNKPTSFEEIENLTHISILMLISKLIFYKSYVDNQTWSSLSPMQIPDAINNEEDIEKHIWQYFDTFKEVTGDFELLIGERSDIIFKIPFVSAAVVELVKEIVETGEHYNFSNIPYDVIGRIFEELIREDERHKLGQYFTPPNVIDLINSFTIKKSTDKVFDPSCGSGTFLVRAYDRKKNLAKIEGKGYKHKLLLDQIYGNDLSNYPAYLSMLNLAIRDTRRPSYPRIINKDFFNLSDSIAVKLHNQDGKTERRILPKFDAIIGNPPYTRQEDIGTMVGTVSKESISNIVKERYDFSPSRRTSIYGYFFYHANSFLKDNGYLAYICQNSWLDTDYGIDMQRFFLNHFEIVAIMDSEVERFFPSASVNTTIVILRKQKDEDKRNANTVKFVYFTSMLAEAIKNNKGIETLHDTLEQVTENTEFTNFRVNCVLQKDLHNHTKWGQFLKAPKVYFDILERGNDIFKPLNKFADIRFGIKTGNNDFFIVENITAKMKDVFFATIVYNPNKINSKKELENKNLSVIKNGFNEIWLIESQFLKPILASPKDVSKYIVEEKDIKYSLFICGEDKKVLKEHYPYAYYYIFFAERKQIHNTPTLSSRNLWYFVGEREVPQMSFNYMISDFGKTYYSAIYTNNNFHNIYLANKTKTIFYYLNSTLNWTTQQVIMRSNLGDGAGKIETYDLENIIVPNINLESLEINLGQTRNYKEELGSLSSLETVNSERLKLDNAILEAIGYKNKTEREQVLLELYRQTYQMIDKRLQKAQSQKTVKAKRKAVPFKAYMAQLHEKLQNENYQAKETQKFARELQKLITEISSEQKLQQKLLDTYWKEKFGYLFNEKQIADKSQLGLF